MTARKLILIRHGESTANVAAAEAEAAGAEAIAVPARDADVPLSALGRQQAEALRPRLAAELSELAGVGGAPVLLCSPYLRAVETARLALGAEAAVTIDERLRDRELGILDALTARGVEARLPQEAARRRWLGKFYYRPPGGEAWTDVALRLRSFLRDLTAGPGGSAVLFTHDAVVSLFLYVLLGWSERELDEFLRNRTVANASVTTLEREDDDGGGAGAAWRIGVFADVEHLSELGVPRTEHPGAARVSN
ncbi:histidine phosphatase family protein [uncultured Leifsonia sp.]|uniref:histidine phosphatase family protein n=1 Tax=Leifsonia sp. TaxID=1870902 RepID=UPI0028D5040A|nr:histidine phosphatase family protein [uncultured Leifsonia sp.]